MPETNKMPLMQTTEEAVLFYKKHREDRKKWWKIETDNIFDKLIINIYDKYIYFAVKKKHRFFFKNFDLEISKFGQKGGSKFDRQT